MVTHLDVERAGCERALCALRDIVASEKGKAVGSGQ